MSVQFSQFVPGGLLRTSDLVVGLRAGTNTKFDNLAGIADTSGSLILSYAQGVGPNVNYLKITNAISGSPVLLTAIGNDVNVSLTIGTQGAGNINIAPGAGGLLSVVSTDHMVIPAGTAGQATSGVAGGIRANTTSQYLDYWSTVSNSWVDLTTGSALSNLTFVTNTNEVAFAPNSQNLSALATGLIYVTTATGILASRILTGTSNRLAVTNGSGSAGNPTFDIDAAYVGQTSITTLGTIGTGVWAGTAIAEIHGGTNQTTYTLGDTLYSSAANTLSKLAGNITAVKQYLSQTGTGAVSAAPAWATISGGDITGAALTVSNDTNVTLTLGGTPATSLLRAASVTAGWTGTLAYPRGGLGAAITADNGAIFYSTGSNAALLASTATASKMLLSGASAAPTWSTSTIPTSAGATANKVLLSDGTNYVLSTPTFPNASASAGKFIRSDGTNWIASTPTLPTSAGTSGKVLQSDGTNYVESTPTYPSTSGTAGKMLRSDGTNNVYTTSTFADTYAASTLLYSNGANTVAGLATANSAGLVTNSSGVPAWSSSMTDGQLIIGSTGATPAAATLTAGNGISITNAANSITIAATGGLTVVNQNSSTVTMTSGNMYMINNGASLVTLTLPTSPAAGGVVVIVGGSSGGWAIAQNASQAIQLPGGVSTTAGVTGSLSSNNSYDTVKLTYSEIANNFTADSMTSYLTYV